MVSGKVFQQVFQESDDTGKNNKKQTSIRHKRRWTMSQQKQLREMNLIHLECLRIENQRVPFKILAKVQRDQAFLFPLRSLNEDKTKGILTPERETELLNAVNLSVKKIRQIYSGRDYAIRLVLLIENLIYLIERAEYYTPSALVFKRLLQLIPPETRLEARLSS